ncbi:hypothetical protein KQH56_02950 [bacterium]|nr:hypothetical protein [bacterium]
MTLVVVLIALTIGMALVGPGDTTPQVSAQGDFDIYFPLFSNHWEPLYSTSYYMITVDPDFTYDLGCELGARDAAEPGAQDSVVVLDFSYPVCNANETYGAELFNFGPVDLTAVQSASQGFMSGYYNCSVGDSESNLVLGIGTNNKPTSCDTGAKMTAHGAAWAGMVDDVNQWARDEAIYGQVQAYGASDIEVGWNSPERSKDWLDGYGAGNETPLIHFGDAAGCPYGDMTGTTCGNGWTQEDVWYVSWGFPPSLPLPLIYRTDGVQADQWARLSRYAFANHGAPMNFTGVFTQSQACEQAYCNKTDNTPSEAYWQLYEELNADPITAQELAWKTDIRWILREEAYPEIYRAAETSDSSLPGSLMSQISGIESSLAAQVQVGVAGEDYLIAKSNLLEQIRTQIESAQTDPAPKMAQTPTSFPVVSDPLFRSGIIEGGSIAALPYGASLTNVWQTETDDGFLQIGAGSYPGDDSQGALYVLWTAADKMTSQATLVSAPVGSGLLRIIGEEEQGLLVQSESGELYQLTFTDFELELLSP